MSEITVVIPTRNRSAYLAEAIASVQAQRGAAAEIVVVDDASTDDTPSVIARAGSGVRTLRLDEHRERSAARNAGLALVEAPFVLFLDDDDRLADNALAALRAPLDDPSVVATVGGIVRVRDDEVIKVGAHPARCVVRDVWPDVLLGWVGTLGRSLLRTSVLREVGAFDESISYGEDWEMWLRLARCGPVALVPEQVLHYRVHEGQSQESDWRSAESVILAAFQSTYLTPTRPLALAGHPMLTTASETGETTVEVPVRLESGERWVKGSGNGPIAAFVNALSRDLGVAVEIVDYAEHALGEGADARAAAYVEAKVNGKTRWGVGVDANIVTASVRAVVSAVNRT
jgi:GT2 family glycosyltransferase